MESLWRIIKTGMWRVSREGIGWWLAWYGVRIIPIAQYFFFIAGMCVVVDVGIGLEY